MLSLTFALKYVASKRRDKFVSFITGSSIIGLAVGASALIIVMSVMNGFQLELRNRILGAVSHATVAGPDQQLRQWQPVLAEVKVVAGVVGAAPYIEREAMIQGSSMSGAIVRGVEPKTEHNVSEIPQKLIAGRWNSLQPNARNVILGSELARRIGARVGSDVTLYGPQVGLVGPAVMPRASRFHVSGIFEVGMGEFDQAFAFVHLVDAQELFGFRESISGVRLKVRDLYEVTNVTRQLAAQLDSSIDVQDWTMKHKNFFQAISVEKRVMFLILSLIVSVAAFNLVASLVMLVNDKKADIAILRTTGMSPRMVMHIFILQGLIIGFIGTLVGLILGITVSANIDSIFGFFERSLGLEFLPADMYYINQIPSDLQWRDVGRVAGLCIGLSLIATIYPSWRASKTQPAEALRYE